MWCPFSVSSAFQSLETRKNTRSYVVERGERERKRGPDGLEKSRKQEYTCAAVAARIEYSIECLYATHTEDCSTVSMSRVWVGMSRVVGKWREGGRHRDSQDQSCGRRRRSRRRGSKTVPYATPNTEVTEWGERRTGIDCSEGRRRVTWRKRREEKTEMKNEG